MMLQFSAIDSILGIWELFFVTKEIDHFIFCQSVIFTKFSKVEKTFFTI